MMGFFRRAASAANRADPTTAAVIALSPSIGRVERLLARGTPANGVITGIRFSLNDDTVRQEYAISTQTDSGWQRIGVRTQPVESHRLRLGLSVVVRFDGDRGVLDWPAMAAAWGLGDGQLSQDSLRRPPDDGVVDTALDARVTAGFDDDPPDGSIAAEIEAARLAGGVPAMSTTPTPLADDPGTPAPLDGTLQGWVDAVRGGHMSRTEFDQSLVDWQSAGMCTASQAAAARTAADG